MRSTEKLIQDVVKPQLLEMTEPTFEQIWDDMLKTFEESFKIFKEQKPGKLLEAEGIKLYYYCENGIFKRSSAVYLTQSGFKVLQGAKLNENENETPKYLGKMDNVKEIVEKFSNAIEQDEHLIIHYQDWSKKENPEFMVRFNLKN